jgi:hypothetical protein
MHLDKGYASEEGRDRESDTKEMVLRFVISMQAYLSDGLERPQLTCLSAFYSGSIDVSPCPRSARRLSRLVTSSAYFPVQSHLSQLCQKS